MSKVENDIGEHSLDNSGDGELLGMVDEGTFGSGEDKPHLVTSYLDTNEDDHTQYTFRDISGRTIRTYKFVSQTTEDTAGGPYFVIGNPVEVFGATSTQKKPNQNSAPTKVMTTKKRDDKRRAIHNEVERRRRDKINNWITKLAAIVPNSGLPDCSSKGGVLAKACDYIAELNEKQKRYDQLERRNEKLVIDIIKLNEELTNVMRENSLLRTQLTENCIVPLQRTKPEKS